MTAAWAPFEVMPYLENEAASAGAASAAVAHSPAAGALSQELDSGAMAAIMADVRVESVPELAGAVEAAAAGAC